MKPVEVVIETRPAMDGGFRADVVEGPAWARALDGSWGPERADAKRSMESRVRRLKTLDTFDFMHVEA